jgi:hypothetical protein
MFDIPDVKRRSAPRRMARIRCEAVSAEGFIAVGGTLTDVSETGLQLEAEVSLAVGEELYLSLHPRGVRRAPARAAAEAPRAPRLRGVGRAGLGPHRAARAALIPDAERC